MRSEEPATGPWLAELFCIGPISDALASHLALHDLQARLLLPSDGRARLSCTSTDLRAFLRQQTALERSILAGRYSKTWRAEAAGNLPITAVLAPDCQQAALVDKLEAPSRLYVGAVNSSAAQRS